jgi:ribonuclease HI
MAIHQTTRLLINLRSSPFKRHSPSSTAAVFSDDGTLLALGGKSISLIPGITSADVEYEGLLFGLQWLDRQWDDEHLIIRGDCKTIVDQLNGHAVPRKLLSKYEVSMDLLRRIGERATVVYQHVLRKENILCDFVCEGVMNIVAEQQVSMF